MASRFFLITVTPDGEEPIVEDLGPDLARATAEYRRREHANGAEVVLLGSESEAVLRRTHSSYFGAGRELGEALGTSS
jgi:hypothetical protein